MALEYDLTTEQGLSAYLTSKSTAHTSITLLTGGTANYVYRVTLPSGETTIYKHAAPYLHSNTNFAFDPSRMDYEDRVLELLPSLLETQLPDSNVHSVGVHSYDRERKLLNLEDGGSRHLKNAYTDPALDIPKIGQALGRWLAALHTSTTSTSLSLSPTQEDKDLKGNNPIAVAIYRHSYNNLHHAFAEYLREDRDAPAHSISTTPSGADRAIEFANQINDTYGSLLASDNECICHGDFWPGNVLVDPSSSPSPENSPTLTIVDWELTRRGTSATDVGQFCAEAFLLDRFHTNHNNRNLLPSFLNAYLEARYEREDRTKSKEWFRRVMVHWGVHVAFWPTRVEWTDRAGTKELVDIGAEVLRAAMGGDWGTLWEMEPLRGLEARFRAAL